MLAFADLVRSRASLVTLSAAAMLALAAIALPRAEPASAPALPSVEAEVTMHVVGTAMLPPVFELCGEH